MDPIAFKGFQDTIEKQVLVNEKLGQEQAELRKMLLALSSQKDEPHSEKFASLRGSREENPRASLASSMERDRAGIGIGHDDAVADKILHSASNSSFAEIEVLDRLARSNQGRSTMDSRGYGDIHLKQSVMFSAKMKALTPRDVLHYLHKGIKHMSENPSQPGLVTSDFCSYALLLCVSDEEHLWG
jgi:hypothetical protein